MPNLSISFKSSEAAAEFFQGIAEECRTSGSVERLIEDNNMGEDLRLQVVDEGSDEFVNPVFDLR
jgi:hypothetical protein